jgi:hypothetical protein
MAKNWNFHLRQFGTAWGVPAKVQKELVKHISKAEKDLFVAKETSRSSGDSTKCGETFKAMIAFMRDLKDRYYRKNPLKDEDFVNLGLKTPGKKPSQISEPEGQAAADVSYPGVHLLKLHLYHVSGTVPDKRADYGYRVYYGIMPPGGASAEEAAGDSRYLAKPATQGRSLPHSVFTRRKTHVFDLPEEDSGKTAYFCVRYENPKGQPGPWGPLFHAIIP